MPCRHCARCVGERARGKIEWLCIQERWNPEVVIILGTAACYRRATVGSSHDDVHPDNQRCTRGRFVPTLALWRASCSYRPVTVLARKCSKCCQLFRAFRGLAFLRGMVQPYFSVGSLGYPSGLLKGEEARKCSDSMGWLFWIFMVHPLLGEEDSALSPSWL